VSYLDDATEATGGWEGRIPWLYRDTKGNVTVGCGKMLPSLAAAVTLHETHPFQCEGLTATVAQIMADWNRLQALPYGQDYAAGSYKALTSVSLPDAAITALLLQKMTVCEAVLRIKLPWYTSPGFPDAVKVALLDMAYNLGSAGLLEGYPQMLEAAELHDWITMAAQSRRVGISDERNAWTATQIKTALAPAAMAG
jgi:GH24 family phage-related lysozyme (muramidase)